MKFAVAIFAHNEEANIRRMLESLWAQDIWRGRRLAAPTEVRCLVNGSSDATAQVARGCQPDCDGIRYHVDDLEQPGKSRTWNVFVHQLAPADAELLVFLDADIELGGDACLRKLVSALDDAPQAVAAVDLPCKRFQAQSGGSAKAALSAAASELAHGGAPKLCGQLYAARAAALHGLEMPLGMLVEDGYLRAMLLTRNFTSPEDTSRLVRAADCWHAFTAESELSPLLRHERRILLGTAANIALFHQLRKLAADGRDPARWIAERNRENPHWFTAFARRNASLPVAEFTTQPLRQWRGLEAGGRLRTLPGMLARSAFNLLVLLSARRALARGDFKW